MASNMEHHTYLIILSSEVVKIDYSQVLESGVDDVRFNNEKSLAVIEWCDEVPTFVDEFTWKSDFYTQSEILPIMRTDGWRAPAIGAGDDAMQ